MAHDILGLACLKMGHPREAIEDFEQAEHLDTGPRMLSTLGYAYATSGARAKAGRILARLDTHWAGR